MTHSSMLSASDRRNFVQYPLPVRVINAVGTALDKLGIRLSLSQAKLLSQAQLRAGSPDWGDTAFAEPLSVLLDSIEKEASLNFVGRFMARQIIASALTNRLKIQTRLAEHPELLDIPIVRPLFIVGYPRTGTTLLQNLLALDPQYRTLRMYEALNPVPPNLSANQREDARIKEAEQFVKMAHYISAQVRVIHALDARAPDECLKLIENTFVSPHFCLYFNIPGYWRWLLHQAPGSFAAVYAYHRHQLQILSQGQTGIHWVLKAPLHLFFLDELIKTYPDAQIVFLHRDPQAAIPSFCSLLAVSRAMGSDQIQPKQLGDLALELYESSYERSEHARAALRNPEQILDIDYQALMNDPVPTVLQVCEHFGNTPNRHLEHSIKEWLSNNPQHKHGVHRYSAEQFSLNARRLEHLRDQYASAVGLSELPPSSHKSG